MRPVNIKTSYVVVFSPDGSCLLSLSRDISLWSVIKRKKIWRVHPFAHPSDAVFSPDGTRIAVRSTSGRIVILDAASGETLSDFHNDSDGEGSNICFSASGTELVVGSWNGSIFVRDSCSGEIIFSRKFREEMLCRVLQPHTSEFVLTEHHPKSTAATDLPAECYFMKWVWPLGSSHPECLPLRFPYVVCSALNPAGTELAIVFGATPKQLVLVDINSSAIRWSKEVLLGGTNGLLKWSPCQSYLASVQKNRVAIYEASNGEQVGEHQIQFPSDVSFSPDGLIVAFGSWKEGVIQTLSVA